MRPWSETQQAVASALTRLRLFGIGLAAHPAWGAGPSGKMPDSFCGGSGHRNGPTVIAISVHNARARAYSGLCDFLGGSRIGAPVPVRSLRTIAGDRPRKARNPTERCWPL